MAAILTGIVLGMREVEGTVKQGPRQGEDWKFLSLEINDTRFGYVWSCQLRDNDPQYATIVKEDLAGHKVKVTVKAQSASPRTLADGREVMQIRSQVTNIRDLGLPEDDDE
jgi:hypothetical protein